MLRRLTIFYSILTLILVGLIYFITPLTTYEKPYSAAIYSENGELLSARIASDEQWRFPSPDSLPYKYRKAVVEYEDKRFYSHAGIDPVAIIRAIKDNIQAQSIVSGASTLTMQLSRLRKENPDRNIWNKLLESIEALKLEFYYTKNQILRKYAAFAPFGSNIVGIEAACRRYLGKDPEQISWSEAALLAVLPNNPALIFPGKNQQKLQSKKNKLLKSLYDSEIIDKLTYSLSIEEGIPELWQDIPDKSPHLLQYMRKNHPDKYLFNSTIDKNIQENTSSVLERHQQRLKGNGIFNAALLIIDISSKKVRAYHGNFPNLSDRHSPYVNHIEAVRSPGSLLKPILSMESIADGNVLPETLVEDIPTYVNSYSPENYDKKNRGLVTLSEALIHSLNVPFVRLLQEYNLNRFHKKLPQYGLNTYEKHSAAYYGLPLILGGGGARLWELTSAYAGMGRLLSNYGDRSSRYSTQDFEEPILLQSNALNDSLISSPLVIDAGSAFLTYEMMCKLQRPAEQGQWQAFAEAQGIAWKTGTSIGFKDAWAIGFNSDYAVGIWAGNADNEGRAGLIGIRAAAPILFDVFDLLNTENAILPPHDDLSKYEVCEFSGLFPTDACPIDTVNGPLHIAKMEVCTFHKFIWINPNTGLRTTQSCIRDSVKPERKSVINISPHLAYYYNKHNTSQAEHIQWEENCQASESNQIAITYPQNNAKIALPTDMTGTKKELICTASGTSKSIYWYVDEKYKGHTDPPHHFSFQPALGKHKITIVDEMGNEDQLLIEIIETL